MFKLAKNSFLVYILLLTSVTSAFGQTINQKVKFILESTDQPTLYRNWLLSEFLNPTKLLLESDETKVFESVERKLSEQEITKQLIENFKKHYTSNEIDDIYRFVNTHSGRKFFQKQIFIDEINRESFSDLIGEIKMLGVSHQNLPKSTISPRPTVIRPDGIYKVVNYKRGDYDITKFILEDKASISITDIQSASDNILTEYGNMIVIDCTLTEEGAKKFEKLTEENIGKPLAIVIDQMIIIAPIINDKISGGKIQISGGLTSDECKIILKKLNQRLQKE